MRLARLVAALPVQGPANSCIHGEHRLHIHNLWAGQHLERMLQFMRDKRNESVVINPRPVARHHDAKIPTTGRGHDERQQTAIQMTERAIAELDVDDAVRLGDPFDQSLE